MFPFSFLNPFEYHPILRNFLLVFWLAILAFMFLADLFSYFQINQEHLNSCFRLICFCIFKSIKYILYQFLGKILSSGFYLVTSECGAYLVVDQRFISWFRLRFAFCSWIYWNSVINFPLLVNLFYSFLIHNEMNASQFKPKAYNYLNLPSQVMLISVNL